MKSLGSQGNSLKTRTTNDVLAQGGLDTENELPLFHILHPAVKTMGLGQTYDKMRVHWVCIDLETYLKITETYKINAQKSYNIPLTVTMLMQEYSFLYFI